MFETKFGNGVAAELFGSLSGKRVLMITQTNLAEKYKDIIPGVLITAKSAT